MMGAPTLYIDADACPVTREALACARKAKVHVVIAGDSNHNLEKHIRDRDPREPRQGFWVSTLVSPPGADSADFAIVSELKAGDVVVTQDFGLASMALGRGCAAIDVRGSVFDQRTIDALLLVRHATKRELRDRRRHGKPRVGKYDPFSDEDRERFKENLSRLIKEATEASNTK